MYSPHEEDFLGQPQLHLNMMCIFPDVPHVLSREYTNEVNSDISEAVETYLNHTNVRFPVELQSLWPFDLQHFI